MLVLGLIVYGIGAVLSAVSPGLGILILGNSIFEGVGTAMLIPPVKSARMTMAQSTRIRIAPRLHGLV